MLQLLLNISSDVSGKILQRLLHDPIFWMIESRNWEKNKGKRGQKVLPTKGQVCALLYKWFLFSLRKKFTPNVYDPEHLNKERIASWLKEYIKLETEFKKYILNKYWVSCKNTVKSNLFSYKLYHLNKL